MNIFSTPVVTFHTRSGCDTLRRFSSCRRHFTCRNMNAVTLLGVVVVLDYRQFTNWLKWVAQVRYGHKAIACILSLLNSPVHSYLPLSSVSAAVVEWNVDDGDDFCMINVEVTLDSW